MRSTLIKTVLAAYSLLFALPSLAGNYPMPAPGTTGNVLTSNGTKWVSSSAVGGGLFEPSRNFIANSAMDYWQRGTSTTVANGATGYQADRWYVKNSLGTNGVITFSRATSGEDTALYDASVKITTAPTASQANGTELFQTIENPLSLGLYNQTASFSIRAKALGNVNQMGVQFYYKTTEAKVDTVIGSEQTCTVSTGAYATCSISGQALGTSQTTAGVIGIRIRITAVSSGNTYDLNNGFLVTKAILNIGTSPSTYHRMGANPTDEFAYLQRFYEKTYLPDTAPATATTEGQWRASHINAVTQGHYYPWKVAKRVRGFTTTAYNPASGASAECQNLTGGGVAFTNSGTEVHGVDFNCATPGTTNTIDTVHIVGDAEI